MGDIQFDNLAKDIVLCGADQGQDLFIISNVSLVCLWEVVLKEPQNEHKKIMIFCLNNKQISKEELIDKIIDYYRGNLFVLLDEQGNVLWKI